VLQEELIDEREALQVREAEDFDDPFDADAETDREEQR
jgi:hypothetical protein